MNYDRIIRTLQQDPKKSLESARRGSLNDLTDLANFWQEAPNLLTLGILDVFLAHLDATKAPDTHNTAADTSASASRAFISLLGLSKAGGFIGDDSKYAGAIIKSAIIKSWPGIFKWCSFFFAVRVMPAAQRPEIRRSGMDVLAGALYSISRDDIVRNAIVRTPEDVVPVPSSVEVPVGTAALDSLLRVADSQTLDRTLKAAGGKADQLAKLALMRLYTEGQKPQISGCKAAVYADLLSQLSRSLEHQLRHALLGASAISTVTKTLVAVSSQIGSHGNPELLDAIIALFGYLTNCLESTDGFTWITQSVQTGLLKAFVECSIYFSRLDAKDREMIISIVKNVLPRYLVYRSVIRAVGLALDSVYKSPGIGRVSSSEASDVWKDFVELAEERLLVEAQAAAWKRKATTCDNTNCLKVDSRSNFRKCAACSTTHYCSKECQTAAWKEGDHKTMCKLKQRERLEGKKNTISKADKAFFHHLSIRDARRHLPHLRSLAAHEYPDALVQGLVIGIDYRVMPEKYSVQSIVGYRSPETIGTVNEEARNDALFEKVRDNQDRYTLLETKIVNGQDAQLVITLCPSFWDKDTGLLGGNGRIEGEECISDDDDDSYPKPALDEIDELMVSILYDIDPLPLS
ncbi:hypothetical protein PILCRDRAFT_11814 [Piloderma croceum F 1598]|uniref:MYND-type domain-containing protein n=1 Tax=Piloderma croceum (strain F 1598) TaxID=765440 RepID=A0A0C3FD08_PILCF|nr:hypothetical protein PILCRDRAFT_11814 [Piloderma croceum F 1598]